MGWESNVVVATDRPSVMAMAYSHVTFEHLMQGGDVDISVRYIDADES
jgi:hypothetical protein